MHIGLTTKCPIGHLAEIVNDLIPYMYKFLRVLIFADFAAFEKVRENLYPRKALFWKILSLLSSFGDFCSISMANPRKYVPAKYGHFYHREDLYQ